LNQFKECKKSFPADEAKKIACAKDKFDAFGAKTFAYYEKFFKSTLNP